MLTQSPVISMLILFKKHGNIQKTDQISGHCGPGKLMYKISHHTIVINI